MLIEFSVAIAAIVAFGLVKLVEALRRRSYSDTYDGAPRSQLEAHSPDGSHLRLSLDAPARPPALPPAPPTPTRKP